ncbi:MAG: hypothetical protein CMH61_01080 [Nanoarchaeota archaeon]|nr:hypothetical protein [Nanoarchaeota archaeon]|tara:strand:+ start:2489 stop:2902 length:414 start_codon:yes stop_codon:yes gene_type:complete
MERGYQVSQVIMGILVVFLIAGCATEIEPIENVTENVSEETEFIPEVEIVEMNITESIESEPVTMGSCTDSDVDELHPKGINANLAGVVEQHDKGGTPHTLRDSCYSGGVHEWYCNGTKQASMQLDCENGCKSGACQ